MPGKSSFRLIQLNSSICGDYGVVYYPSSQTWYLCTFAIKWNSSTNSYDSMKWQQTPLPTRYNNGAPLYMHLLVTNTGTTDRITITIKDGVTFQELGSLYYDFPGNPFNSTLSNLNLFREITMAQHLTDGVLNTSTGTITENSKFYSAYLYTPSSYSEWGTQNTSTAYRKAPTYSQLSTIVVNSYTKWSSDDISIRFNQ